MQKILEAGLDISGGAGLTHYLRPTFLMCSPEWYDVDYVINPWMAGNLHRSSRDSAFEQWKGLYAAMRAIADVKLLHPRTGSPDMVFVGHAAVANHGVAAVSSFAHAQRQPEEKHLREWLADAGFLVWDTPRETPFEGEGDMLFDPTRKLLWAAHGARTCRYSHRHVGDAWHAQVESLHLVDPRFYHLDTCFAPLSGGEVVYFPGAFDAASRETIERLVTPHDRIEVTERQATRFACNVINVGRHIVMNRAADSLAPALIDRGYRVAEIPLGEFVRGGGAAKSLALRLSDVSVTHQP